MTNFSVLKLVALKRADFLKSIDRSEATEAVLSAALALRSVDDVHGGHRLPFYVFVVGDE